MIKTLAHPMLSLVTRPDTPGVVTDPDDLDSVWTDDDDAPYTDESDEAYTT